MLSSAHNTRGARGQGQTRSRGRGRGSSSTHSRKVGFKEPSDEVQQTRLDAPSWPTISPARQHEYSAAMDTYWRQSRDYRAKLRQNLIQSGLLDDPTKAKKLSEAINFKGTCEEMCPIFERATRINESDVKQAEMALGPDGNMYVVPDKMVKANARSAAGQDAPLPMDVRSPAALRRTLDYLFNEVLGDDVENLYNVHNFLWDRTRAIRRDFVFQSSMDALEMGHQTYCLERIVRFHAISLHQMSKIGISTPLGEDFSEQQEVEQLSKALLSLMHCYDDCNKQKVRCDNEPEFRAYYVLFNCRHPGVLQNVQAWGYELYDNSHEIQTAVAIAESMQNIWNMDGPLTPHSATDVAQNAYAKFFTIIQDRGVSYTMACFAEIHFNSVRKSILRTVLASYRKQRNQTKDWSLTKLNVLLKFDHEDEIVGFGEAYGLDFEEADGEIVLSFGSGDTKDPFPPLKQAHSFSLVECKREHHTLPEAISHSVFNESAVEEPTTKVNEQEEESLFVPDNTTKPTPFFAYNEKMNRASSDESEPGHPFDIASAPVPLSHINHVIAPPSPPEQASAEGLMQIQATQNTPNPFALAQPAEPEHLPVNPVEKTPSPFALAQPAEASPFALTQPAKPNPFAFAQPAKPNTFALPQPAEPEQFPFTPVENTPNSLALVRLAEPEQPPLHQAKVPNLYDRESQQKALTNWICFGEDGLIEDFVAFAVEAILKDTEKQFKKEERKRIARDNVKAMRIEADAFRYRFIATKYFQMWRDAAQHLRLKRRGRAARKARQDRAENLRASKAAQPTETIADFKASTASRRRGSLESLLDATGVLDGVHDPGKQLQTIVPEEPPMTSNKRQRSHKLAESMNSSTSSNRHKRGKSDNPYRRSLLSDPLYLAGGSRIYLMSSYGEEEGRRQISGVQTDYFRLKARGISTLPDGTPLASSVAKSIVHRKRSFDGISKRPGNGNHQPKSSYEEDEGLFERAKRIREQMDEDHQPKRPYEGDDEEDEALFERAKRVREQMDEGSLWYRAEIARQSGSRSVT
jgi:hypothetical protein